MKATLLLCDAAQVDPAGKVRCKQQGAIDEAERCFAEALAGAADDRGRALAHNKRALVALARGDPYTSPTS